MESSAGGSAPPATRVGYTDSSGQGTAEGALTLDQEEQWAFLTARKALPGCFIGASNLPQGNFVEKVGNILMTCDLLFFGSDRPAFEMEFARRQTVPGFEIYDESCVAVELANAINIYVCCSQ
jgi:hypothetical protein